MDAMPGQGNLSLKSLFQYIVYISLDEETIVLKNEVIWKLGRPKAPEERGPPSQSAFTMDSEGRNPETTSNSREAWQAGHRR